MKLSTRGRYGTRLMLELTFHHKEGPVLLKDISLSQNISLKYLGQIIIPLKIAGLVKSVRGARGGYLLAKHPDEIKLSDIIKALEGEICIVECIEDPDLCDKNNRCATQKIWKELNQKITDTLNSYTLSDLVNIQKTLDQANR